MLFYLDLQLACLAKAFSLLAVVEGSQAQVAVLEAEQVGCESVGGAGDESADFAFQVVELVG